MPPLSRKHEYGAEKSELRGGDELLGAFLVHAEVGKNPMEGLDLAWVLQPGPQSAGWRRRQEVSKDTRGELRMVLVFPELSNNTGVGTGEFPVCQEEEEEGFGEDGSAPCFFQQHRWGLEELP